MKPVQLSGCFEHPKQMLTKVKIMIDGRKYSQFYLNMFCLSDCFLIFSLAYLLFLNANTNRLIRRGNLNITNVTALNEHLSSEANYKINI